MFDAIRNAPSTRLTLGFRRFTPPRGPKPALPFGFFRSGRKRPSTTPMSKGAWVGMAEPQGSLINWDNDGDALLLEADWLSPECRFSPYKKTSHARRGLLEYWLPHSSSMRCCQLSDHPREASHFAFPTRNMPRASKASADAVPHQRRLSYIRSHRNPAPAPGHQLSILRNGGGPALIRCGSSSECGLWEHCVPPKLPSVTRHSRYAALIATSVAHGQTQSMRGSDPSVKFAIGRSEGIPQAVSEKTGRA
ncbi:hypothetical protein VUR80DRAFT_9192 [Thermomyces stellatus]